MVIQQCRVEWSLKETTIAIKVILSHKVMYSVKKNTNRGADKSLARPGRKQATATEDFDVHISYL
jgi:hypothetical protein